MYERLIASIVRCLRKVLETDSLTSDSRESLEVSIQCLESAYNIDQDDETDCFDILHLYNAARFTPKTHEEGPTTAEMKEEAERLKNEGNDLIRAEKYHEAAALYTKAIELHPRNAVYYCNRAAVYSKLGDHRSAIRDCQTALHFDPQYSKAYGRLGLAHSSLEEYGKAKEYYEKAIQLEPANESLKNNLQIVDEKLNQQATTPVGTSHIPSISANPPHIDFTSMLRNPVLLNMAKQMLSDPSMQNMMSTLMSGALERDDGMDSLLEAGQQMAQEMQRADPALIESLKRQMEGASRSPDESQRED